MTWLFRSSQPHDPNTRQWIVWFSYESRSRVRYSDLHCNLISRHSKLLISYPDPHCTRLVGYSDPHCNLIKKCFIPEVKPLPRQTYWFFKADSWKVLSGLASGPQPGQTLVQDPSSLVSASQNSRWNISAVFATASQALASLVCQEARSIGRCEQ